MAFYPPRNGGGGGGPVTGLTGTPTEIVYIDNAGNGTGDALATRDSSTFETNIFNNAENGLLIKNQTIGIGDVNLLGGGGRLYLNNSSNTLTYENTNGILGYLDLSQNIARFGTQTGTDDVLFQVDATAQEITAKINDTTGGIVNGLTVDGTTESNLGIFNIGTGEVAGHFVTNTAGVFSADFGWTDGITASSSFVAANAVVSMATTDGSDLSSIVLNPSQGIAKSKLFKFDSNIDRTFVSADTQTQIFTVGDTTNSYTGSLITIDSNNSIFTFTAKANASTTISNTVLSGTGNSMIWDSDIADDIEAEVSQGDNLLGVGIKGNLIAYSDSNTGEAINIILGDATAIGGGAFTSAIQYVLGDVNNNLIVDSTGASFQYDNVATTTNSSVQTTSTYASSRWTDGTIASLMRLNNVEALLEYDNGTTATSVKVEDGVITVNNPIKTQGYTVATLPTGAVGQIAYVTDALAPSFLVAVTGGGAIVTPVFHNGTTWVAY